MSEAPDDTSNSTSRQRSVKIGSDERGGWSSERPLKEGETERPRSVAVRGRLLAPSAHISYPDGALIVVAGPDAEARRAFIRRVFQPAAILTAENIRERLGAGASSLSDQQIESLIVATARKRLVANQSVVVESEALTRETRAPLVALAHFNRHFVLLDSGKDDVAPEQMPDLNATRQTLLANGLGEEGFSTSLRLGRTPASEVVDITFVQRGRSRENS